MARIVIHLPSGKTSHALDAPLVTVGRVTGNTIRIDDPSVSAHHAKFYLRNGRYFLRDLDSTNKTWIDGEAVDCAALQGKCAIRFGTIETEFADEAEEAPGAGDAQLLELKAQLENIGKERDTALATNRELAGKLAEEATKIETLTRTREADQTKLRDLTDQQAALEKSAAELIETKAKAGSIAAELEAANARLSAAAAEAVGFKSELAKQTQAADELTSARREIDSITAQRDRVETESADRIAELQSARAAAEKDHDAARAELSKQVEKLEKEVSTAVSERDGARTESSKRAEALEKQIAAATSEREAAQAEFSKRAEDLEKKVAAALAERDEARTTLSSRADEAEKKAAAALAERDEVRAAVSSRASELEKGVAAATAERDEARTAREQSSAQTEALRQELAGQKEEIDRSHRHVQELQEQIETQRTEASAVADQRDAALRKTEEQSSHIATFRQLGETANAQREALTAKLAEQSRQLAEALKRTEQLATERDTLIKERNSERELAAKLADAEQQLELFAAQQRAVTAELEKAKLAERELNTALAESPRLVKWLHGGLQKQMTQQAKADLEANKIVSIDAGKNSITEAVEKMRRAVELCEHSPVEGLRELGLHVGVVNARTESSPHRRAVHRLGSTLGLLIGEMRSAPHHLRSSGLRTVSDAIEILTQLLREENPPVPAASAIIVDRDVQTVQTAITAMKSIEFKFFCAEELRPALEALAAEHHELILLDWHASESASDLRQIRAMPRHQQTPVIFLAQPEDEAAARAVGDGVLVKPLTAPEVALKSLTAVLDTWLASSRREPVFTIQ